MSTRNVSRIALAVAATLAGSVAFAQQKGPALGEPISAADLAPWDISVETDGTGLPPGSGDATKGAALYATACIACHGAGGTGKPNDALVGGQGTLTQLQQVRTVGSYWPYATTVFDYIRRAMPFHSPQSLSNDDVYSLTAYLLAENGIIDKNAKLDASSLAQVKMPNRDGFIMSYPERAKR
jgi:cytochrome c